MDKKFIDLTYLTEDDEVVKVTVKRVLYKDIVAFNKAYQLFVNKIIGEYRGYIGTFLADSEENYQILKDVLDLIPIKQEPGYLNLEDCVNDYDFLMELLVNKNDPDDELGRPYIVILNKLDHAGNIKKAISLLNLTTDSILETEL